MKVIIDENAGFCGGVKKTINLAEDKLNIYGRVFSLCELIHNSKEIERLEKYGLKIIEHKDLNGNMREKIDRGILITRAHGEKRKYFELAKERGFTVFDGTCGIVAMLQKKIEDAYKEGYQIIIVGKKYHPEVIGLLDRTKGTAKVILNINELKEIDYEEKTAVFAQTTISEELFDTITEQLKSKFSRLSINKTICNSVLNRKEQIRKFMDSVDTLVFVGGKNSSNTRALVEYCKNIKDKTFHIESETDIDLKWFGDSEVIGITGGASTPKWLMENVKKYLINNLTVIN